MSSTVLCSKAIAKDSKAVGMTSTRGEYWKYEPQNLNLNVDWTHSRSSDVSGELVGWILSHERQRSFLEETSPSRKETALQRLCGWLYRLGNEQC